MKNGINTRLKNVSIYVLIVLIFNLLVNTIVLSQCTDTLVCNSLISGQEEYPPPNMPKNEFKNGKVYCWQNVFGTADIVSLPVSVPTAGRAGEWYYINQFSSGTGYEGFGQVIKIDSGKTYLLSFMGIRDYHSDSGINGNIEVYIRNYTNSFNTVDPDWSSCQKNLALLGATQLFSCQPTNNWQHYEFCFTATQNTDFLFFTLNYQILYHAKLFKDYC